MTKTIQSIPLEGATPGARFTIAAHRFGTPGARPKVYVQGGLHADEMPGMMAAHALIQRLDRMDRDGAIAGEIVVVPAANPLGLGQSVLGSAVGRFDLDTGGNFNRHYPDLATGALAILGGDIPSDGDAAVIAIRQALVGALAEAAPANLADRQRHALLSLAIDADIVLDLHCDSVAPVHLYMPTALWPRGEPLARWLGAELVLLADVSGGEPFDEACSTPWWHIKQTLGAAADHVPMACLAVTVELRGGAETSLDLAGRDADGLIGFLAHEGALASPKRHLPDLSASVRPLAGVAYVQAPIAGIPVTQVRLGQEVAAGERVATLVRPGEQEMAIHAPHDGVVWSLIEPGRRALPGDTLVKTVAEQPLDGKGGLLLTP